jgi:hypothetical protein
MGLDLSRIEAWTRAMLEAEARRRRIRDPEFRTRSELIRVILKHQYGDRLSAGRERIAKGVRAFEQARGLLSGVVNGALSLLPEPLDDLLAGRGPVAQRRRARAAAAARAAQPQPLRGEGSPAPSGEPARGRRLPIVPSTSGTEPSAAPSAVEAPAAMTPRTRTFVEEPIRTHSMARLLAAQGHRERALAIYEELLAQNSEDVGLRQEAESVRQGRPIDPPLLPDRLRDIERAALPDSDDLLRCEGDVHSGLQLRWHITEGGLRRARAVLGSEGDLAVRLVAIRPHPEQVVRSEITEHGPVAADDAWQSPAVPDAARCFAAVGVRDGDRFVAIVHAHPTAPGSAQPDVPAHAPAV